MDESTSSSSTPTTSTLDSPCIKTLNSNDTQQESSNSNQPITITDVSEIPGLQVRYRSRSAYVTSLRQASDLGGHHAKNDLYDKILHRIYPPPSSESCDACELASPVSEAAPTMVLRPPTETEVRIEENDVKPTWSCYVRALQRHILARKRYKAFLVTVFMVFLLSYATYQNKHHLPSLESLTSIFNRDAPGLTLQEWGLEAHHPVVLIPGIISSGLELWETLPCAAGKFRSRVWGSASMLQSLLGDPSCWLQHMALNGTTGLDPAGIRVRAAQGLEAADFFMPGYWLWAVAIEQLSHVGYDPNNMALVAYDWRLSLPALEVRDGYFFKLRSTIETLYHTNGGRRVVVAVHSMGGVVWHYFASRQEHLQRGWVEHYVHAIVHVGTPHLGVPKAISATLSGEMKDTAELGDWIDRVRKIMLGNVDMVGLFRSFHSVMNMAPRGGARVWGSAGFAADEQDGYWLAADEAPTAAAQDAHTHAFTTGTARARLSTREGRCGAYLRDMWRREGMMEELFGADVEDSAVCSVAHVGDYAEAPQERIPRCSVDTADAQGICDPAGVDAFHSRLYSGARSWYGSSLQPAFARVRQAAARARETLIRSRFAVLAVALDSAVDHLRATYAAAAEGAAHAAQAAETLWVQVQRVSLQLASALWELGRGLCRRAGRLGGSAWGVVSQVGDTVMGDRERGLVRLMVDLEHRVEQLGIFAKIDVLRDRLSPIREKIQQVSSSMAASLPDAPLLLSAALQELEELQLEDLRPDVELEPSLIQARRHWWQAVDAAKVKLNELRRALHGATSRVTGGIAAMVTTELLDPQELYRHGGRGALLTLTERHEGEGAPTQQSPAEAIRERDRIRNTQKVSRRSHPHKGRTDGRNKTRRHRAARDTATVEVFDAASVDWHVRLCGDSRGELLGVDVVDAHTLCEVNNVCSACASAPHTGAQGSRKTSTIPDVDIFRPVDFHGFWDVSHVCRAVEHVTLPQACIMCACGDGGKILPMTGGAPVNVTREANATTPHTQPTQAASVRAASVPAHRLSRVYTASTAFTLLTAAAHRHMQRISNIYGYGFLADRQCTDSEMDFFPSLRSDTHDTTLAAAAPVGGADGTHAQSQACTPTTSPKDGCARTLPTNPWVKLVGAPASLNITRTAVTGPRTSSAAPLPSVFHQCELPGAEGGGYPNISGFYDCVSGNHQIHSCNASSCATPAAAVGTIVTALGDTRSATSSDARLCPPLYSDVYSLRDVAVERFIEACRVPAIDGGAGAGSGNVLGSEVSEGADSVAEAHHHAQHGHTARQPTPPIAHIVAGKKQGEVKSGVHAPPASPVVVRMPTDLPRDMFTAVSRNQSLEHVQLQPADDAPSSVSGKWAFPEGAGHALGFMEAQRHWSNPLASPLPFAPSVTIYNLYGIAKTTERRYFYRVNPDPAERAFVPFVMDKRAHAPARGISHGVGYSDGDGTVPLLSLGYMCGEGGGWSYPALNPAGMECVTREYLNKPASGGEAVKGLLRTDGTSGDHVDIIGNNHFISDLAAIASRVNLRTFRTKVLHERDRLLRERQQRSDSCAADAGEEHCLHCGEDGAGMGADSRASSPPRRLTDRVVDWLSASGHAANAARLQRLQKQLGLSEEDLQGVTLAEVLDAGEWPFEELPDAHGVVELLPRKHSCIDEISKRIKLPLKAGLDWAAAKARKRALLERRREDDARQQSWG